MCFKLVAWLWDGDATEISQYKITHLQTKKIISFVSLQHTPGVPESSTAETDLDSVAVDGEQQAKQAWFKAVHSGDLDKVKQLLDSKTVEVNTTDEVSHYCDVYVYVEVSQILTTRLFVQ